MTCDPIVISSTFLTGIPVVRAIPVTSGHINATWFLFGHDAEEPSFVLQRINHHVFRDVEGLMSNISLILSHLEKAQQAIRVPFVSLRLIPVSGGGMWHRDPDGYSWRMYNYIPGSKTYDAAEHPQMAHEAGRALGTFQRMTSEIDGSMLQETIPQFHHTGSRLSLFREVCRKDPAGRRTTCGEEIGFAEERAEAMHAILKLGNSGDIPLRVTHNDPKFNNILFNEEGRAIGIIDLDTVMPGYSLYDFGDAVRTGASAAPEDEPDLSKAGIRMDLFTAYTEGYLSVASEFLQPKEISHLAFSARFMTWLIGLRFLTDHLDGDRYFRIRYEGHNLVRARSQFRLVRSMEDHRGEMEEIVQRFA